MTPDQRDLIRCALGMRTNDGMSTKNLAMHLSNYGELEWERMRAKGWAERGEYRLDRQLTIRPTFRVTRAGAEAAGVLERCRREDVER